ncbi:MAG: TonB-dependent receptor [Elusimicrobiota bacterium]|nr:TonB-dependent receptor [Elusimicrobiota bacterium]
MFGKVKKAAALAGFLTVGLVMRVQAQEALELEDVVITGTKTERRLKDVPVRTEIITSREIEDKGAVNLYEILEGVPGIRVEQQCSYCNFSVVRMQGLNAGHVQVLIDGQPIFSGLAGVYGLDQIPASNIERIEIVKGAGSALYGSSAISGVINILTKKPSAKPDFSLKTEWGEHGMNLYSFSGSIAGDKKDIMITAQKSKRDEIFVKDESKAQIDAGTRFTDAVRRDNTNMGARVSFYDVTGDDKLTFTGRTSNEIRKGGEGDGVFENPFAEGSEHIATKRQELNLGWEKDFYGSSKLGVNFAMSAHNRNATNDTFVGDYKDTHGGAYPPSNELNPYIADEDLYVMDLSYVQPLGEKNKLLTGIQYSNNLLEESGMYVNMASSTGYKNESEKSAAEIGLYIQNEFKATDKLEIVTGVRYDKHSSEDTFMGSASIASSDVKIKYDESSVNPRIALKYEASEDLVLRTSLGTGFRVPYGFSEDLHLCSGSPRVYKGSGLKPEKSVSFNFGIDRFFEKYSIGLNFFRTNLTKKIDFADAGAAAGALGYDYEWTNLGNAYSQGVEAGLKLKAADDFDVDCNLTYTDAQYKDKREDWEGFAGGKYYDDSKFISRVPEMTAGLKLAYRPEKWNFVWDLNYTGSMYIDYAEEEGAEIIKHTDAFMVNNVKVSREVGRDVTLSVGAKNLFDYIQDDKRPADAAFMWAPYTGRTVYGGMEVKF